MPAVDNGRGVQPPAPCTLRTVNVALLRARGADPRGASGDLMEGETTMDGLAGARGCVLAVSP